MLTLPDFKEKKILYIIAQKDIENQIKFWNSNIRLYQDGTCVNQISCHLVLCIFIIGNVTITSVLIEKAKKHGISMFLLNHSLKSYAEILSLAEGNYKLRTMQYTMSTESALTHARHIMHNKLTNQYKILKHYKNKDTTLTARHLLDSVWPSSNNQELLGIEGNMANIYFRTLYAPYNWHRRAPQTREDITNFLLDIGYTFLFNYVDALLHLFGFDTYKGVYHQLFFQRKSLSCDMMEPMRCIIDRQIRSAYNLGQINEKDFEIKQHTYRFKNKPGVRSKYCDMFFQALMHHKEDIYTYIRKYYLYCMDPTKYTFPVFSIR